MAFFLTKCTKLAQVGADVRVVDVLVVDEKSLVTVFAFANDIGQVANRQDIGAFKKSFAVFQGKSFFGSDLDQYIAKAGLFYK